MPVDYDRIREENILEYGRGERHLAFLGRLYSDRTHFIFELIQNAEDAGATELTFTLEADRLEVRHDGRAFTEADVRGICGIGEGTKADDLTAIGKFGIGFKSVYAYTRRPEVHCRDEHFAIEHYVRPHAVAPRQIGAKDTLFVFPFDREDVDAGTAVAEISEALNNLELESLLFLRCIDTILLTGSGVVDAVLAREIAPRSADSFHATLTETAEEKSRTDWRVWSRQVPDYERLSVQIAFSVSPEGGRIKPLTESPLVVFFPTAKETHLGFLAQGPYRTTPARDNIPEHDAWNALLVRETAALMRTALRDLRDEGLIDVQVLQAMPLDPGRFPPGAMLRPIFDEVRSAFREEPLIPVAGGGHTRAPDVKLARGAALRELLDAHQLAVLYESTGPLRWIVSDVTADRTPLLYTYLRESLGIDEVTPESAVTRLSDTFLEAQSNEWLVRFYAFLQQNRALWARPSSRYGVAPIARMRSIIRLEDGSHTRPFDRDGRPLAYLPTGTATEFPTVRASLAREAAVRDFLGALGLVEPDVIAEVLEMVLPRYANGDGHDLDTDQHANDLDRIARAVADNRAERAKQLRVHLRATPFLQGRDVVSGATQWCRPPSLYAPTPSNRMFLDGNPRGLVLDERYEPWLPMLLSIGVQEGPTVISRPPGPSGYVTLVDQWGHHERGVDGFDPDGRIDHLELAVTHPTPERSKFIWNELLCSHRHLIAGVVEKSSRQNFVGATRVQARSGLGEVVASYAWLPAPDGSWARPDELGLSELPAEYKRDEVLARALGMKTTVIEELSREAGLPVELVNDLRDPEMRAVVAEALERKRREKAAAESHPVDSDAGPVPIDYVAALADVLDRPGRLSSRTNDGDAPPGGSVTNPDLRRERLRERIARDQGAEPPVADRFQPIPRRVWEAKDRTTRHFLEEQYGGRCQICGDTFLKRDGWPYFEAVYLVSRTNARWIDRPGNVLCLCATCSAKVQFGPVVADGLIQQIMAWCTAAEGGPEPILKLSVCGEHVDLRFTEKHLLELQEMVATSDLGSAEAAD